MVSEPYGRPLSTVFNNPNKETDRLGFDEDEDPSLPYLRFLDYRYIRFCYQPIEDKFFPTGAWKDPSWTNTKTLRTGLDAEERDYREQVFGANVIDIQQKSIPQILIDEVCRPQSSCTIVPGTEELTGLSIDRLSILSTCSK